MCSRLAVTADLFPDTERSCSSRRCPRRQSTKMSNPLQQDLPASRKAHDSIDEDDLFVSTVEVSKRAELETSLSFFCRSQLKWLSKCGQVFHWPDSVVAPKCQREIGRHLSYKLVVSYLLSSFADDDLRLIKPSLLLCSTYIFFVHIR